MDWRIDELLAGVPINGKAVIYFDMLVWRWFVNHRWSCSMIGSFLKRFGSASLKGLRLYFDFSGRTSKSDFWFFLLFFIVAYVFIWLIDHYFLVQMVVLKELPFGNLLPGGYVDEQVGLLVLAYRPVMMIPTMSATVRRLRDVGKSGWWSLLWVLPVPVVGWFWLIPWLVADSKGPIEETD